MLTLCLKTKTHLVVFESPDWCMTSITTAVSIDHHRRRLAGVHHLEHSTAHCHHPRLSIYLSDDNCASYRLGGEITSKGHR
ncbi:hypothetical protein RHMOL_Rhmol06G0064400 [Rhododendron molle]|uniref:Uncharacterized protein n=2 Tax=Rhododendron molle TaxID=49168 RepID=A0ACC0N9T5_RHOML|nr:hypothetical protein RHMOL_Rhmol06G0064400 [Rhododendron molle]